MNFFPIYGEHFFKYALNFFVYTMNMTSHWDRVLVSIQWEVVFPLCSLKAVTQIGLDDFPLLFSLGEGALRRMKRFHFEPSRLLQPGSVQTLRLRCERIVPAAPRVFVQLIFGTIVQNQFGNSCEDGGPPQVPSSGPVRGP